ncbi:MAG: hypothetical protein AAGD35_11705 [Actinomycetota bacterium]
MRTSDSHPAWVDEFGLVGPLPADDGQRQHLDADTPTGPEVGTRLPDFTLPSANGRMVSFHADRGDRMAAVVFFRSAVW